MAVQFIRGTADMDLSEALLKSSVEWLAQDERNEVFYLVPNHMKFEQEIQSLKKIKQIQENGTAAVVATRFQVFSFYRLAWYYLQNTRYYSSDTVTEAGAAMIFRKILTENKEKLTMFQGEVDKAGFIQQLLDLYHETEEGTIELEQLLATLTQDGKEKDLVLKVADIQLLFTKYEEIISQYGVKSEKILDYLTAYSKEKDMAHVLFVVHGYQHFSARELKLIKVFMQQAGQIKISLLVDTKYPHEVPSLMKLFHETGSTYHQLYQLAQTSQIPILTDYVEHSHYLLSGTSMRQLVTYWQRAQDNKKTEEVVPLEEGTVNIWAAETIKEEIHHIAREIRRLVCEENYRYQDIQLLTREMDDYETVIDSVFSMHAIPYYLDRDMAMEQHPLVEFIQAFFDCQRYNYRYRDVLRLLRTELFFPMGKEPSLDEWGREKQEWRDTVDIAENVIIMYGFEGHFWKQEQRWTILNYNFDTDEQEETKQVEEQANKVRSLIQGNIPPFFERIKKTTTGQEAATQFYHFLLENGIEKQLMMWRNEAVANGQLELAKNHEQTWQALMTLLDEYVTIYGEEYFCLDNFMTIFSSGLEGLRYNKVPTAIDQVQIRTLDLASPGQAKIVFAVGLTNQVLPQKYDNQTLLSDEERVVVNERLDEGQFLLKNTQKSIAKEPFLAYLLFSSAQERIYLSYPQIKDGIKDLSPSPYLSIIQKGLKINVQVKRALTITDGEEDSLRYIGTYRTLISELTALKRQEKEMQGVLSPFWLAMEKELLRQPLALKARQVFSSLTHKNVPENLSEKLADQLYGKEIYTSVSRMESFHRCQYQYFSHFGLKLQERERFGLTAAATGDFFHEALDVFFKLLRDQKQSLINLTNDELGKVTDETLRMLFADAKFFILNSSSRMNYIRYQLSQTIKKMSWVLKKQSQRSGLTPLQTEVLFGQLATQKGLKGLDLALDTGGQIHVRGKIDRIDQLVTNEAVYLGVIDYKSSHKNFSLTEAYHGLAMQMLTYLDVVLADASTLIGQPAKPAGSLYMHVHNPVLPYSRLEDKEQLLVKQFKFDGLLVNDTSLLEALDTQIEAKQTSPLYPIEESAKEVVKPGRRQEDKFVTHEELQGLLKNNRRKFVEAGNQMTQGSISLNPAYQGKERIACRFCAYRSVCTFDVMLQENQYHRIEHLTKKEIMDQLLKKENRGGQDE